MKTIGLTGGIGSGKSTAARILAELGAAVIDADRIGHDVYRPGTAGWKRVVDAFGPDIVAPDGTIDRQQLGKIVFADPAALRRLNEIVHPLIAEAVLERIIAERAGNPPGPVVIEAAVLIEANWVSLVDEVWVVVADRDAVVSRVARQRGLDEAAIQSRISAQVGDEERRRHAHVVIENNGTIDDLRARLAVLWQQQIQPSGRAGD